MAWSEINLGGRDSSMWDKENPNPLEGRLAKIETNQGPNNSTVYTITQADGTDIKVWGSTVLDDKLLGVSEGSLVKISYEGKAKSKKGTYYHDYKVWIDSEGMPGYEKAKAAAQALKKDSSIKTEDINIEDLPRLSEEELNNIPY